MRLQSSPQKKRPRERGPKVFDQKTGLTPRHAPARSATKVVQCAHQVFDIRIAMQRGRGDAQALGLARNGRVVDRLHINTVAIEQDIRNPFALAASPTMTGRCGWDCPYAEYRERREAAQLAHAVLIAGRSKGLAFRCWIEAIAPAASDGGSAVVKMKPEAKERMKSQTAAEPVMYPPMTPKALPSVPSMIVRRSIGLRARQCRRHAGRTCHSVDFVEIGHGAITIGEIADFPDRRDIAVHGVNDSKAISFGAFGISGLELGLEVLQIIVLPDHPLTTAIPDASIIEAG